MVKEQLKQLGMTDNEIDIYLTLLKKTEQSVGDIASRSGLHRQVCYDALERLLEKGFVSYVIKNSKKYFKPLEPKKIIDYLEQKKEGIKSILPELNGLFIQEKEETEVEVIKGKNVIRTIYNDIHRVLRERKETLYAMGIEETKFLEFDEIGIRQHILKMKKNKLKEKLLSKETASFFFPGAQSEYRLIPDYLFNPNPTHIYGNNVAIIIWGDPTYGIIIRSKQVADANRKYFQILWETARKAKKKNH